MPWVGGRPKLLIPYWILSVRCGTLADRIRGVRIVQSPPVLRHFTSHFAPVADRLIAR